MAAKKPEDRRKQTIDTETAAKLGSPVWRLSHLYNIRTKVPGYEGRTVTFAPNKPQRKIYDAIEKGHKRIIVLKPRKLGVTTAVVLYLLDKAMYSPNQWCRSIAHRRETVSELFNDIARYAFDRIEPELRPEERHLSRNELDFAEIGSKYSIDIEARGHTPSFLHFSEVAYVEEEVKLQDSLESLPLTAVGIAESTANGKGGFFHQTFMGAWDSLRSGVAPDWYPIFFPWWDDPTNALFFDPNVSTLHYPEDCALLKAKYPHLTEHQLLWWDRKKFSLQERVHELYPATPEEAFIHSTGRVYPEFSPQIHVIPKMTFAPFKTALDFGQRNPTAILLIHQDSDGNFIVFDEFYRRECPPEEIARWLKMKGITRVEYPDPSVFNKTQISFIHRPGQDHRFSIADEFRRFGIILCQGAQNDVETGIIRMKEYLRFDHHRPHPFKRDAKGNPIIGSPRLFITENCENLIQEFYNYRWAQPVSGALDRSERENPIKEWDHALDSLRYCVMTWGKPVSQPEDEPRPRTPAYFLKQLKDRQKTHAY